MFLPSNNMSTTTSIWMKTEEKTQHKPLEKNVEVDVCVIGAGIAGITTAYHLTQEGKSVIVLDDGEVGEGETGRTTAHLAYALDDRFQDMERWIGKEHLQLAAQSHISAIDFIEKTVKDKKIDCDFLRVDGYLFLGPDHDADFLKKERDSAHAIGLKEVTFLETAPTKGFDTGPCLHFPAQGQFHPLKYLHALASSIEKSGGKIYTNTRVTQIEEDEQPVIVHTEGGHTVKTHALVVATNAPINDNAMIYSKQAPYRSFVIALKIPKGAVKPALYWDTQDPYHYVRIQEEKEWDILIAGGEDHKTGQADDMELRLMNLERWTRHRFPMATDIVTRWSGQVMETLDGLAMIGRKPMGKNWSYIATGDSGMGMTHGTIAGILLTDLILNRKNAWEEIYKPGRFELMTTKEFLKENLNVAKAMVSDWVAPSDVKEEADIKPGSGAVVRKGVTKIALYRDPKGTMHRMSAVCPHKGCIVQWNDGEKSWDCPCHGSRYDARGNVLNGPTLKPLSPTTDSD